MHNHTSQHSDEDQNDISNQNLNDTPSQHQPRHYIQNHSEVSENSTEDNQMYDLEKNEDLQDFKSIHSSKLAPTKKSTSTVLFLGLCLQSLGGIYGDLGTSPLYTFSSIFHNAPSREDVLGATSCIFWSITLVVIFKYCWIVFTVGTNQKQGGAVAVYAKLASRLGITPKGVEFPDYDVGESERKLKRELSKLKRTSTQTSFLKKQLSHLSTQKSLNPDGEQESSSFGGSSRFLKKKFGWVPLFLTFICTGLIMADGLLTPTTSVLSAIGGIAVVVPSFSKYVVLVSCIILAVVFLFQRFGSGKVSYTFGPIIMIWMICLAALGIYNIRFYPGIFAAFSPKYAIDYLLRRGIDGLGPVILSITGCEAMFADLGHYSVWSVRFTMLFYCYPALLLSYFGQAARLIENPELYVNTFFMTIPSFRMNPNGTQTGGAIYWVVFVLSTLATIIACQATILGVSSMYMQLENIDCLPKLSTLHTSQAHIGKIYIPFINYLMAVAVILTTIGFKNSNNVTNAYGFCIALTFFFTTCLIAITMSACYSIPWPFVLFFFFSFGTLDMCFSIAGVRKFTDGAWFPLMVSVLIIIFLCLWRWGRSFKSAIEFKSRVPLKDIISKKSLYEQTHAVKQAPILDLKGNTLSQATSSALKKEKETEIKNRLFLSGTDQLISRLPGMAVFHTEAYYTLNSPNTVPGIFGDFVKDFPSLHETVVFLGARVINIPFVDPEDRLVLVPIPNMQGFFRGIVRFGFMEPVAFDQQLMEKIRLWTRQMSEMSKKEHIMGSANCSVSELSLRGHNRHIREAPNSAHFSEENCEISATRDSYNQDANSSRPPVHIYGFEALKGTMRSRTVSKWFYPVAWLRDGLINVLFEPIDSICRPREATGNVVQSEEYKQNVFTLSKTSRV